MDTTNDRLWDPDPARAAGFAPTVATYGVVGSEDADSAVARIVTIDADRNVKLEVLPRQRRVLTRSPMPDRV